MTIRVVLFLLALAVAVIFAIFVAAGAAMLVHVRGSHPAASIAAGAVAFGATMTLATLVASLTYTVLYA
jgi:hypothetical protein